jgi:hypothetical protein
VLEVVTSQIVFPPRSGFGPQVLDESQSFANPIQGFTVGLTGFELRYDSEDHHFKIGNVDLRGTLLDPSTVEVSCTLGLRDQSSDWDDSYSGFVSYAILARTEARPEPPLTELSGYVLSVRTSSAGRTRDLLIRLYVPIEERIVDLTFPLTEPEPQDLVLTALLRDALAQGLPVTCFALPLGRTSFTLKHVELRTRGTYHQASWIVNAGDLEDTGDKPTGVVTGVLDRVSVSGFGVIKGSNEDLPDIARVTLVPGDGPTDEAVELFLALQRPDLQTNVSILLLLFQAHREGREVTLGFYLEPLRRGDDPPVRWIQRAELGRGPDVP